MNIEIHHLKDVNCIIALIVSFKRASLRSMRHLDEKIYINTGGMDRKTGIERQRLNTNWVHSSPGRLECQLNFWMTARNIQPTVLFFVFKSNVKKPDTIQNQTRSSTLVLSCQSLSKETSQLQFKR